MQNDQDERILNLLRLKEEMEKELKKRGLLRDQRGGQRQHVSQPKIEIEPEIDLPVEKIWALYDLNYYAYGFADEILQKSLQRKLYSVKDEDHRYVLLNLIKLLRGERIESPRTVSIYTESLKILSELYSMQDDVIKDTVHLLKNYPSHPLAYLTAAEVFLAFGKFLEAYKLFQMYSDLTKDPYVALVIEAYMEGQFDSSTFATCVSRDGYKSMLLIISALTEAEEKLMKIAPVLEKRNFACAQYVSSLNKGKASESFPYCSRLLIYREALKFVQSKDVDQALLERVAVKDPLARLLLVSINLKSDPTKSFEQLRALLKSVGEIFYVETEVTDKPPLVKNVIELRRVSKNFQILSKEEEVEEFLKTISSNKDAWIFFKDPEYLRLYFGERHCRNTCLWEG